MTKHTISAEQLLKAYNGTMKYLVADKNGRIWAYEQKPVFSDEHGWEHDEGKYCPLGNLSITEFENKSAEECIYKAKPSEEDWIGKLCFFADVEVQLGNLATTRIHVLQEIIKKQGVKYKYIAENNSSWALCRPVRPDEIKFFNDDTSED